MSEITKAIAARQTQIAQLQSDIDALQRAASVLGGKTTAAAIRQPTTSPAQPKTKRKRKRKPWSAAARKAMSKRVKASWAKRKKASAPAADAPAPPTGTRKRKRKPMSAAAKKAMSRRLKAF